MTDTNPGPDQRPELHHSRGFARSVEEELRTWSSGPSYRDEYRSASVACGLGRGTDLPPAVLPFILRNVALLGTGSASRLAEVRAQAWVRLGIHLATALLDSSQRSIPDAGPRVREILAGQ